MAHPAPPSRSPHVTITRCTPADIPSWLDLTNRTFLTPAAHESSSFLSLWYPDGVTPEIRAWALSSHIKACASSPDTDFYLLAHDATTGSLAGAARWQFHPATTPEALAAEDAAAAKERAHDAATVSGVEHERLEAFRVAQKGARARLVEPGAYLYLKVVGVAPEVQRRGVGAELVRWGAEWADERGVKCYLESSVVGRGLYEKFGFRESGYLDWDAKRFDGVKDSFLNLAMVRESNGCSTDDGHAG